MSEWQPIESAPKDECILAASANQVIWGGYAVDQVKWSDVTKCFMAADGWPIYDASHWMPLPPPPTE